MDTVRQEKLPLEKALKVVTSNPADILKLKSKGRIAVEKDADVALLTEDDQIDALVARGQVMIRDTKMLVKGTFE